MRKESMRRMRRRGASVRLVALLILSCLGGCSTAVHGTTQQARFAIQPPDTKVILYRWDGEKLVEGTAAQEVEVPRPKHSQSYLVKASRAGYCPRYALTENELTAMGMTTAVTHVATLGLIWIIPIAIDHSTGGSYEVKEQHFTGSLEEDASCGE